MSLLIPILIVAATFSEHREVSLFNHSAGSSGDVRAHQPFHTHYGKLEQQLTQVGLCADLNQWEAPLTLGADHEPGKLAWSIQPPRDFYTFSTPFDMGGETTCIPGGLPTRYQKAMMNRERQVEAWQRTVKESGLTKDQKSQYHQLVESRFQEWLHDSGNKRQLDGLVPSKTS